MGDFSQTSLSTTSFSSLAGWLKASTLQAIRIPVPTNLPINLGIYGALYLPTTLDTDGVSCAPTDGTYAYDSAALASYTGPLTISGNTNVPLNLWVTRAGGGHLTAMAVDLPPAPNAASCSPTNGNMSGALSQTCPSLNFEKVKLACGTGDTNCTSNFIQFDYLNAINGPQHITHLMDRSQVAAASLGAVLPYLDPMQITLGTSSALRNQNSGNTLSISTGSSVIFSSFSAVSNPATQASLDAFYDIPNTSNTNFQANHCIQVTVTLKDSLGVPVTLTSTSPNNELSIVNTGGPTYGSISFYLNNNCVGSGYLGTNLSLNSNPTTLSFKVTGTNPGGSYSIALNQSATSFPNLPTVTVMIVP